MNTLIILALIFLVIVYREIYQAKHRLSLQNTISELREEIQLKDNEYLRELFRVDPEDEPEEGHDDKWRFFNDNRGKWRWRRLSRNNKTVGASTQGYKTYADCMANAKRNGYEFKP